MGDAFLIFLSPSSDTDLLFQAPSVGSGEASLPGVVEPIQPQFISRFLEGQSGVTIKSVSCGDLFTTCMTGQWAAMLFFFIYLFFITNQRQYLAPQSVQQVAILR